MPSRCCSLLRGTCGSRRNGGVGRGAGWVPHPPLAGTPPSQHGSPLAHLEAVVADGMVHWQRPQPIQHPGDRLQVRLRLVLLRPAVDYVAQCEHEARPARHEGLDRLLQLGGGLAVALAGAADVVVVLREAFVKVSGSCAVPATVCAPGRACTG